MEDLEHPPSPFLKSIETQSVKAGLDAAEKDHADDVAFEARTDGDVEIEGKIVDKGRLSLFGFAQAQLKGAKDFAAGVRGKFSFKK